MLSTLGSGAAWARGASRAAARLAATARRRGRRVDMGDGAPKEEGVEWPYCTTAIARLPDAGASAALPSPAAFPFRNETFPPMSLLLSAARFAAPLSCLAAALATALAAAPLPAGAQPA